MAIDKEREAKTILSRVYQNSDFIQADAALHAAAMRWVQERRESARPYTAIETALENAAMAAVRELDRVMSAA